MWRELNSKKQQQQQQQQQTTTTTNKIKQEQGKQETKTIFAFHLGYAFQTYRSNPDNLVSIVMKKATETCFERKPLSKYSTK